MSSNEQDAMAHEAQEQDPNPISTPFVAGDFLVAQAIDSLLHKPVIRNR